MSAVAPDVVAPTAVATHAPRAIAHEVVWGPISKEEADACRALAPCSAVLLSPLQTAAYPAVEQAVRAVIPQEILPRDSDTADSLRKRLAQSAFLDDGLVRKGGAGGRHIRLNTTDYAQARTVSWAEGPCAASQDDEGGASESVLLPFYRNPTRLSDDDVICRPWPAAVQALRDFCHALAYPYMGELSRAHKQDHLEVKIYYTLFKSKIGKHRDNFTGEQLYDYLANGVHPFSPASTAARANRLPRPAPGQ